MKRWILAGIAAVLGVVEASAGAGAFLASALLCSGEELLVRVSRPVAAGTAELTPKLWAIVLYVVARDLERSGDGAAAAELRRWRVAPTLPQVQEAIGRCAALASTAEGVALVSNLQELARTAERTPSSSPAAPQTLHEAARELRQKASAMKVEPEGAPA